MLYEPVHKQLVRYCRAISGNITDAEDLVNETVLTALENFSSLKNEGSFKAFLFGIAGNLHKMMLRRKKFRAEFNSHELYQITDAGQNPEYATEFQIIYDKIKTLPAKTSETLILFHVSDLSLEEIQKIQGGSLSAVKLRLKRGREKLLAMLNTPQQVKTAVSLLNL